MKDKERKREWVVEYPAGTSELTRVLGAYSANIVLGGSRKERGDLMLRAMRLLWSEREFRISGWTERRVRAFCEEESGFVTVWGPSSSGKSTDFGAIVLVHWLSAPMITTCTVCSTTRPALVQRIFGEIVRLYLAIGEDKPGEYKSGTTAIVLGDENTKNGIFGVAVLIGNIKDAMSNMIGKHNRRNVLIVDEMQGTREAAVEAVSNLQGGEDFHFVGIGNPESRLDPLGRYSEPEDGWESIDTSKTEWKTKFGRCVFFDGRKSPAIVEPDGATKYPYLIKKKDIEQRIKWYGENSPKFWSQTIGFIPPEGLMRTIFSESFFIKHGMMGETIWQSGWEMVAGLDPSFSSGGDRSILSFAKVGRDKSGRWRIQFCDTVDIPMEMKGDEPLSYGTARKVKEQCLARGVEPVNFGIDTTGTQTALADIIETEWGRGIMRVSFSGKPSKLPVSLEERVGADERYANRVTELWYNMYQYGRHGHIGGLGVESLKEFCARLLLEKLSPICVEPKSLMKGRAGRSPDDADSKVIVTALVRERLGVMPGQHTAEEEAEEDGVALREVIQLEGADQTYMSDVEQQYVNSY